MNAKYLKPNWARGIFRIVGFLFVFAWLSYYEFLNVAAPFEVAAPLGLWSSWNNGLLMFVIKVILIPATIIALFVYGIYWCAKGFYEPKLNWKEGLGRQETALRIFCIFLFFVLLRFYLMP